MDHHTHVPPSILLALIGGMVGVICLVLIGWFMLQSPRSVSPPQDMQEEETAVDETALTEAYYDSLATLRATTPLTVAQVEAWLFAARVPASLRDAHLHLALSWAAVAATTPTEVAIREWLESVTP